MAGNKAVQEAPGGKPGDSPEGTKIDPEDMQDPCMSSGSGLFDTVALAH